MKRINVRNIMEKGGLMIEALAMLGLIAVVTPTMYKKSAERTMEIEDINTATTIRTISNAADSYVSANYSSILADMMTANQTVRTIDISNIEPYLPYGFDIDKSLVNYGIPKIGVHRQDALSNNLTTFVLFPAKSEEDEGIGQERTTRIASLIGANGGYTKKDKGEDDEYLASAKGIGGIWALDHETMENLFSESDGSGGTNFNIPEANSIVTASSETIDISAAGEANNDKYLQRGLSEGEEGQKWRTTMATDLYMGGVPGDPIYNSESTELHSIRNVAHLVIGAATASDSGGDKYGLYITGNADAQSAYIGGALKALAGQFQVTGESAPTLGFITAGASIDNFQFEIDGSSLRYGHNAGGHNFVVDNVGNITNQGDITTKGSITNQGDIALAQGGNNSIAIGKIGNAGDANLIAGNADSTSPKLGLLMNGEDPTGTPTGYAPQYGAGTPDFNVEVGSNMKVHGILAANQLDTNEIRASSLSVGSQNVDDEKKWMTVDKSGVKIADPKYQGDKDFNRIIVRGFDDASPTAPDIEISVGDRTEDKEGTDINISQGAFKVDNLSTGNQILTMDNRGIQGSVKTDDGSQMNIILTADDFVVKRGDITDSAPETEIFSVKNFVSDTVVHDQVTVKGAVRFQAINPETGEEALNNSLWIHGNYIAAQTSELNLAAEDNLFISSLNKSNDIVQIDLKAEGDYDYGTDKHYGSIYIREGMIDVASTDTNGDSYGAKNGTGIISASRFVANNKDFVSPLTDASKNKYNGSNNTYYDTYMVNPAYTSVMHDIKLTTRAGARLSDILPDFINKGIYVVRNSYSDEYSGDLTPTSTPTSEEVESTHGLASGTWASPYAGEIPAPQCPPGYGRVITLTPASFEVAQSGNIAEYGGRQFVKRTSPLTCDGTNCELDGFKFVKAKDSVNGDVKFSDINSTEVTYVIGSNSTKVKPFSVQQSNWLKTHVRPTYKDGFAKSWSALMGFIYMKSEYEDLIKYLTEEKNNPTLNYQSDGSILWNIFPVRRNSIDAYATVYCYFDRSNALSGDIASSSLVDQSTPGEVHEGFEKDKISDGYRQRLNDPTLKYNEVW